MKSELDGAPMAACCLHAASLAGGLKQRGEQGSHPYPISGLIFLINVEETYKLSKTKRSLRIKSLIPKVHFSVA
jgi:hypothetical protein